MLTKYRLENMVRIVCIDVHVITIRPHLYSIFQNIHIDLYFKHTVKLWWVNYD